MAENWQLDERLAIDLSPAHMIKRAHLHRLSKPTGEPRPVRTVQVEITEELVEDALEHVWDFAYLGDHPLASLRFLRRFMPPDTTVTTYLDLGEALSQVLQMAMRQLGPSRAPGLATKNSRYYDILYQAYIECKKNRDVALALKISERTFYRDRLKAIAIITRVLVDVEGHRQ